MNYEKTAGFFAILCLFMSIIIIYAIKKYDDQTSELAGALAYIEVLEETQNQWCPPEIQGYLLAHSLWRGDYRTDAMLACFYKARVRS